MSIAVKRSFVSATAEHLLNGSYNSAALLCCLLCHVVMNFALRDVPLAVYRRISCFISGFELCCNHTLETLRGPTVFG